MSTAAALPKIRQLAVLPHALRPVKLMIIAGGVLALLAVILATNTAFQQPAVGSPVPQTDTDWWTGQNTDPAARAVDPAAVNVVQVQAMNAVQPTEIHFASFDANSSLLPGNVLPTSAQCGIAHRSLDQANKVVRDCYARNMPGYLLVHFVGDASTGAILSTSFYVGRLMVRDLINQWGVPLGYRTNNASSVIYWAGKRAYLTSARLRGVDKIDFISFDDTNQYYQLWTALTD